MKTLVQAVKDFLKRKFDALKAKIKAKLDALVQSVKDMD